MPLDDNDITQTPVDEKRLAQYRKDFPDIVRAVVDDANAMINGQMPFNELRASLNITYVYKIALQAHPDKVTHALQAYEAMAQEIKRLNVDPQTQKILALRARTLSLQCMLEDAPQYPHCQTSPDLER